VATATRAPEHAILDGLRAGDPGALETLMDSFAPRVYRLAHAITRSASDAEEVVQDVFMTILRKADRFEGRSAVWTWIYRITTNAALNKRRSRRTEAEVPIDDHLPTYTADGHRAGERAFLVSDWSATPESELLSGERRARLEAALDALPPHYRAVLVLRDVEELSNEQVAAAMGESTSAVKARLHRARMALREDLTRTMTSR
jgi:RNA polymerase sigma-70 factor (ECF subfamily)